MTRMGVKQDYFEWLFKLVCEGKYDKTNSYRSLLLYLHDVNFKYIIRSDADRARDGANLRHRFALMFDEDDYDYIMRCLDEPCSIFEMILALAIRCEETIMVDPQLGDRTGQWFWMMIVNLGLGSMTDVRFDERHVDEVIDIFLNRDYESDGSGGLFKIRNCKYDLRNMDIWSQLCQYLDTMI